MLVLFAILRLFLLRMLIMTTLVAPTKANLAGNVSVDCFADNATATLVFMNQVGSINFKIQLRII